MSHGGRRDRSRRDIPRRSVTATACAALALVVAATCSALIVAGVTGRMAVLTVPSPSMTPAIPVGSAIAAAPVRPAQVRVGDVIVFRAPASDHLTVHRVVQIDRRDGVRLFQTRGDANATRDPWDLRLEGDTVHRVVRVVPHLGLALAALHRREVRFGLLGLGATMFLLAGLRRIWRDPGSDATRGPVDGVSVRRQRRARAIAAAVAAAAVAVAGGEAQAQLSTASGSVMPVSSAALGTPTAVDCAWDSASTLSFSWTAALAGVPDGTTLGRATAISGPYATVATVTPATAAAASVVSPSPVTTNRFYRLGTYRGATWTGPPSTPVGSADCRGAISTPVGSGTSGFAGDGGPAASARLNAPRGLAVAPSGDLYIADTGNSRIRRVDTSGTITTFAGGSAASPCTYSGPVAGLGLNAPYDVEVDAAGNVYIADTAANCVRMVDASGNVTRVAGGGATTTCNASGPASSVSLSSPRGIDVDGAGTVYIADSGRQCIRKVVAGTFSHVAGGGATSACIATGPATSVSLSAPNDVDVDSSGAVYIADTSRNCIRMVVAGTFSHVLGGGGTTTCGATGAPTSISLSAPEAVIVDPAGTVVVADRGRRCVRAVSGGSVVPFALTGTSSSAGDGGPAVAAAMRTPSGLAVGPDGTWWMSDRAATSGSNDVRSVVGPWPG